MKKVLISLLLTVALTIPAAAFSDVPSGAWYEDSMNHCVEKGLFNGTSATTFSPNGSMTRAMFVAVLYRYAGQPDAPASTNFTDVAANAYYAKAVAWAVENGITNGTSATTFSPNTALSRQQLCALLVRFTENYLHQTLKPTNEKVTFSDEASISAYAREAVSICQQAGIINGTDGKFNPTGNATRAHVCAIVARFDKSEKAPVTVTPPQTNKPASGGSSSGGSSSGNVPDTDFPSEELPPESPSDSNGNDSSDTSDEQWSGYY